MIPDKTPNNCAYGSMVNIIFLCEGVLRYDARCIPLPDFNNLGFGNFRPWRLFTVCMSFLGYHVLNVVSISSQEQVIRAYATGIVAMMTYKHSFRDRPMMHYPGYTVGKYWCASSTSSSYAPISLKVAAACPQPTGISLLNFRPKAIFKRLVCICTSSTAKFTVSLCQPSFHHFKRGLASLAGYSDTANSPFMRAVFATKPCFMVLGGKRFLALFAIFLMHLAPPLLLLTLLRFFNMIFDCLDYLRIERTPILIRDGTQLFNKVSRKTHCYPDFILFFHSDTISPMYHYCQGRNA